jgi:hypothetical protein
MHKHPRTCSRSARGPPHTILYRMRSRTHSIDNTFYRKHILQRTHSTEDTNLHVIIEVSKGNFREYTLQRTHSIEDTNLHVIIEVSKGDFRLDHPELSQVARCVGVFLLYVRYIRYVCIYIYIYIYIYIRYKIYIQELYKRTQPSGAMCGSFAFVYTYIHTYIHIYIYI